MLIAEDSRDGGRVRERDSTEEEKDLALSNTSQKKTVCIPWWHSFAFMTST